MKKKMKKILCSLLVVVMCLTVAPLSGFVAIELPELNFSNIFNSVADAAEIVESGTWGDNITWTLDSEGTVIMSGTGDMMDSYEIEPPAAAADKYGNGRVTPFYAQNGWGNPFGIPDGCYLEIKKVIIEQGITSIGSYIFYACSNLTDITILNKMTEIRTRAFSGCSSLKSFVIPDGITSIGEFTFENCSALTSITMPASLTTIGYSAFFGCDALTDVYYAGTEEQWNTLFKTYASKDGDNADLFNATIHFKNTTTYNNISATLNDGYFSKDSKVYNHDLAKFCSLFTVIGYTKDKDEITKHLNNCGFSTADKYIDVNAERDEVNYFIANQPITVNGQSKNLVFVACIGSHKDQWYSNFDPLGKKRINKYADDSELYQTHIGFADAREYVYGKLEEYVQEYGIDVSNSIVLLTGHSRGAATINLLAAKLIDNAASIGLNANNVYAYGFATPNTVHTIMGPMFDKYKSIINIVNPEDLVTKLLPAAWGYGRYGVTYTLPSATNSTKSYYNSLKTNMQKEYALLLDGATYHPYPGGEKQTYNVVLSLSNSVSDINQLYEQKFWWNNDKVSVQQFITQTLCKYMATSDKKEKASVETALAEICLFPMNSDEVIFDLAYYFVMYQGILGSFFEEAHQAETYCAYIMSMASGSVTTKRDAYKGTVNCPVDVEIYDTTTGELVGRIVDNVIDNEVAAGDNAIVVSVDGDSKEFWLPSDGDYEVKLIGNDSGTMDYTLSEIDSDIGEVKRVNFFDVEITDGFTMTADFASESFVIDEHELVLDDGSAIEPTEIFDEEEIPVYSIAIATTEGGTASSSRTANSGDYVSLSAVADEDWEFIGWFENDELICNEADFAFVAKSDRNLTAKFKQTTPPYTLGDIDNDGNITSSDARTALRAAVGLDELNASQQKAADVDKNGTITSADARLILRCAVGLETF